jgi:hypothetical protein
MCLKGYLALESSKAALFFFTKWTSMNPISILRKLEKAIIKVGAV